jgi:Vacuolar sorting-associated protein 13, N-terminal
MHHNLNKETPRFDIQLLFDEIGVLLDNNQYRDFISLIDMYHFYTRQHQVSHLCVAKLVMTLENSTANIGQQRKTYKRIRLVLSLNLQELQSWTKFENGGTNGRGHIFLREEMNATSTLNCSRKSFWKLQAQMYAFLNWFPSKASQFFLEYDRSAVS